MQASKFSTPKEFLYNKHLKEIGGKRFTFREVDIITCILHNRGEKKIASLLTISPRTVGAHVHNVMLKCGVNSRDGIIDFIEQSGLLRYINQYYLNLVLQKQFESCLKTLGRKPNNIPPEIPIYYEHISTSEKKLLKSLESFLSIANIQLPHTKIRSAAAIDLHLLSEDLDNQDTRRYFLTILHLLQYFIDDPKLSESIDRFQQECDAVIGESDDTVTKQEDKKNITDALFDGVVSASSISPSSFRSLIVIFILTLTVGGGITYFFSEYSIKDNIRSELPLPHSSVLLSRSDLIDSMEELFQQSQEPIKKIVLVGVGGAGKTILARHYAKGQNNKIVWEINAETQETLLTSFEELADSLCENSDDQHILEQIARIADFHDKRKRLRNFVTKRINHHNNWLIIYNNVESFSSIKKLFPYDHKVWGKGKVIITTRDSNFTGNYYLSEKNILKVGELTYSEKYNLFTKIVGAARMNIPDKALKQLIEELPSFPLDVSTAAYYIKGNNLPYDKYMQYMHSSDESLSHIQEDFLKDVTQYPKSRYDIITTSVRHIIEVNQQFEDLLILISTLDSENIPLSLLNMYVDEQTVEQFMHELNKFSFITESPFRGDAGAITFSIHKITQEITLDYLMKLLKSNEKKAQQFREMILGIERYVSSEIKRCDIRRLRALLPHLERFADHSNFLSDRDTVGLRDKLGVAYYATSLYEKSLPLLKKALKIYSDEYGKDHINTATVATHIASVYRNTGNYNGAFRLLKSSLKVFKQYYGERSVEVARIAVYLGSIARNIGDYDSAQKLILDGYSIYSEAYNDDHPKVFWTKAYLGNLNNSMGRFKEAAHYLEAALAGYIQLFGPDHTKVAWAKVRLANIYRNLDRNEDALEMVEESLKIYERYNGKHSIEVAWAMSHYGIINSMLDNHSKAIYILEKSRVTYSKHLVENHIIIAWCNYHLAESYRKLGEFNKAEALLQESLRVYIQYFGPEHVKTAAITKSLGLIKVAQGALDPGKILLLEAKDSFQRLYHPRVYECLEGLAETEIKLAQLNPAEKLQHIKQASVYLNDALKVASSTFAEESQVIAYIRQKIEDLKFHQQAFVAMGKAPLLKVQNRRRR